MSLAHSRTNCRQSWPNVLVLRVILGSLCLLAIWGVLYQPASAPARLTDAQTMAILTTHCPALRQRPDVLGCLPDPAGILLITDRPALMPTQVAGLPVRTEPPPPHLPPPPGVIVLRPEGPDPQPTLSHCPPGYTEQQKYRWRFCNSPTDPQSIPTSLMALPIAGVPYARVKEIFRRQDFMQLPGVQSVSLRADGIVVQTTEPALIPSSFEGLPVQTEEPKDVFRLASHTLTEPPSILRGGVAIGDHLSGGTLGGFVWSGGEPWLVTAAHNFPSKCGDVPPCPTCTMSSSSCRALHECRNTATSDLSGIPAKLARKRTSPAPPTVSTLTRWTPLTRGATLKVDVAAGPVNVDTHPISRSPEGFRTLVDSLESFSRMVTGHDANPIRDEPIALLSAYDESHTNTGRTGRPMWNQTVTRSACGSIRSLHYQDLFVVGTTDRVISDGTSGGLVINGEGNILGMHILIHANPDYSFIGLAAKASNIKTALNFDHWVGSETMPLRGGFERVAGSEDTVPQLKGWAYDPLNPAAQLPIEVYVNGEQGTGRRVGTLTTDQVHSGIDTIDGISGKHGYTWTIPAAHRTGDPAWSVYALDQTDTPQNPAIRTLLPELKLPANWTVSNGLLEFLKDYEDFIPYPYDDTDSSNPRRRVTVFKKGDTTICYGHLVKNRVEFKELVETVDKIESLPDEATKEMRRKEFCDGLFRKDWEDHADIVKRHVKVPVSQSCFDALASLAFNLGEPKFAGKPVGCESSPEKECKEEVSSVWKKLQNPSQATPAYPKLEAAWKAWRKSKGEISLGVIRRRRDEWTMCDRGAYDRTEYTE